MYFYITSGTREFMKNKWQKNNDELLIFENNDEAILLHETVGKSMFASPRKYVIISEEGIINQDRILVLDYLFVDGDYRPVFEEKFERFKGEIAASPKLLAYKLLRPINAASYALLTCWDDQESVENRFDISNLAGKSSANVFEPRKSSKVYWALNEDEVR